MKLAKVLSVAALVAVAVAVSGCAGSLGWNSSTALPRGSYDEERIDRVGPRRSVDACGSSRDYGAGYSIPAGYMLVPEARTTSPCQ
jgi:hypothetical protein